MKKLSAIMGMTLLAFAPAMAGEVTFVAEMTGVTWNGCKIDVGSAFKSLAGVKDVKIERHDKKQGMQKVTLLSDGSADISKEQAIESLGQKAAKYVVVNWSSSGGGDAASQPEMKSNLLAESQEWTNKAGTTITAAVLKVESGKVYFLMDGKTIPYEVDNLSGETIERLKGIMAQNAQ